MALGFGLPVGVSQSGGAKLEEDPQHLATILHLALQPGQDDNPFQELGLSEAIIFSINDSSAQALARNSIERILSKFADRLTLDRSVPITFGRTAEGQLEVSFRYIDLDTNKPEDFRTTIG